MSYLNIFRGSYPTLAMVLASSLCTVSCIESSSTTGASTFSVPAAAYSGPGSKWDFSLNSDSTFSVEHRPDAVSAIDMTIAGTFQRLASGFVKLTVSSTTGNDTPTVGEQAWALEVPGYAMMVKPMGANDDQMIAMVAAGTCPTADIDGNWVMVKKHDLSDATDASRDFYGTFHYDVATSTASLPGMYSLANDSTNLGPNNTMPASSCSNGVMLVGDAVMYLTTNGAIVHTGNDTVDESDDQFIFGLQGKAITNVVNLDGNYVGMAFDGNGNMGTQVMPISFSCTSGVCAGNMVTDIDTGALSAESVTVNLSGGADSLAPGLITGTITSDVSGFSGNLSCMADINAASSGKKIISCVGQAPDDNTAMFNVMMVSK